MNKIEDLFANGTVDRLKIAIPNGETAFLKVSGCEYRGQNHEEVEDLLGVISKIDYDEFLPFAWFFKGPGDIFFGEIGLVNGSTKILWDVNGKVTLHFSMMKSLKFHSVSDKMMYFDDPVSGFIEQDPSAAPLINFVGTLGYFPDLPSGKNLEMNFDRLNLKRDEK